MKKLVLVNCFLWLFAYIASASVEYNGLNYNLNTAQKSAVVVKSDYNGDLVIPESISIEGVDYEVTEIDKYAFQASYNLTSVKLPKSIKTIGALAFANGNNINIYISDLSSWCSINFGYARSVVGGKYQYEPIANYRLFLDESEIEEFVIPEDISYLRKNAFAGCLSITKVSINDNVNTIDDYAFYKCSNLKTIEFGQNVTTIGEYTFCRCISIEQLTLPQSLQTLRIGALQSIDKLTEISLPGNLRTLESGCFLGDNNLTSVRFEDSDKDIFIGSGQYNNQPIFMDCPLQSVYIGRSLKNKTMTSSTGYSVPPFQNQTTLTSVHVGEGVKVLDSYLFYGCSSLVDVYLPNTIEEIGSGLFEGCTSLPVTNNIQYAGNCAVKVIDNSLDNFDLLPETRLVLSGCFSGCSNIKTISLPSEIVYWGDGAFSYCNSLLNISIPEKVKKIGSRMFYGCESLSEIIIPDNIKTIGEDAFSGCKSLSEIVIPGSVTHIFEGAFYGCESIKKVRLEDSDQLIGIYTNGYDKKSMFLDCPLEDVYMGRNVSANISSGGQYERLPFYNKKTLKTLTIGKEVTNIWDYSFYGCTAIENIFVHHETPISLENYTFSSSIYSTCKLNVPDNSVSLYSTSNVWRNFQNIESFTTSIENISNPIPSEEYIYDINGAVSNNYVGIKILKMKDGKTRKIFRK